MVIGMVMKQQTKEEASSTEVEVPRVTPQQAEERAERAFDAALEEMISTAPPQSEIDALQRELDQQNGDLDAAMAEYCDQNQDSTIANYYYATGNSTSWMVSRGSLGFNRRELQATLEQQFAPLRQQFVSNIRTLSDPSASELAHNIDTSRYDSVTMQDFTALLSRHCTSGSNAVPVSIESQRNGRSIRLRSRLQAAEQEVNISDDEASITSTVPRRTRRT